jgi:hypothetical protein
MANAEKRGGQNARCILQQIPGRQGIRMGGRGDCCWPAFLPWPCTRSPMHRRARAMRHFALPPPGLRLRQAGPVGTRAAPSQVSPLEKSAWAQCIAVLTFSAATGEQSSRLTCIRSLSTMGTRDIRQGRFSGFQGPEPHPLYMLCLAGLG